MQQGLPLSPLPLDPLQRPVPVPVLETMLAIEKANISFRLLTKIQNKVISAYEEIQRLQL
ncbi:MAG: flagellar hook-basal body complex protein FliE [Deltaproteobacteria bacterium]